MIPPPSSNSDPEVAKNKEMKVQHNTHSTSNTPALVHSDGEVWTTSLDIAKVFGKTHKDVLERIQKLAADVITLGGDSERTFPNMVRETVLDIEIGSGAFRRSKAYLLNERGFSLVAMGFTGVKALQFKLAYVQAFDDMKRALSAPKPQITAVPTAQEMLEALRDLNGRQPPPPPPRLSEEQNLMLFQAKDQHYKATGHMLRSDAVLKNISPITPDNLDRAILLLTLDALAHTEVQPQA